MKEITLGGEGLRVPAIGLGCMGMSDFYGESDEQKNIKLLNQAIEMGCNFWDTSDIYGPFTNEELLGKVLQSQREKVVLASKFGIVRNEAGKWLGVNGRPEYVKSSCEASLRRLNTDYIDVYYQHRFDPDVPIEETVGAMADLVAAGKVKYLGLSEASPEILRRAHKVYAISVLQTEYSLWSREVETEILPATRDLGIGFVAYSPLGRGFLSGTIRNTNDLKDGDWRLENPRFQQHAMQHNQHLVDAILQYAKQINVTSAQLSLAWLLAQGDDIALIPGTRHYPYLLQNWQAQNIDLYENVVNKLSEISMKFNIEGDRY